MTTLDKQQINELEQYVESSVLQIKKRAEYYKQATKNLHKYIIEYFFSTPDYQEHLKAIKTVSSFPWQVNQFTLDLINDTSMDVWVFTRAIHNSTLGLKLEKDVFVFPGCKELKPEVFDFMNKLAIALSIYRICLGIKQNYERLLIDDFIQFNDYKHRPDATLILVNKYEERLKQSSEIQKVYESALTLQEDLKEQRVKISEQKTQFETKMQLMTSSLMGTLEKSRHLLLKGYNDFVGDSWFSSNWHGLVKQMAQELFNGQYSVRYKMIGALQINNDYDLEVARELDECLVKALKVYPKIKSYYLSQAEQYSDRLMKRITDTAKQSNIMLTRMQQDDQAMQLYPMFQFIGMEKAKEPLVEDNKSPTNSPI